MQHIGFIMDGNRTWARENNLPQFEGHRRGYENAKTIISLCRVRNIPYASFWALSDDNIRNRSTEEVSYLFDLLARAMPDLSRQANEENIRITIIGDRTLLNESCNRAIEKAEQITKQNSAMTVILAIGYGGQEEIIRAIKNIVKTRQDITVMNFNEFLDTGKFPPPDLIIRTGGHMRHSGFFLFQSLYSEYFFSGINWPDFDEKELDLAILDYSQRNRKFGK